MPQRIPSIVSALILILLLVPMTVAAAAAAEDNVISAKDAYALVQQGQLTIIDIRRPSEWKQTGIPAGAQAITMHDPAGQAAFLEKVTAGVAGDKSAPIGLICASGVRSTWASGYLARNGFTQILNIKEGMLGRGPSPGWMRQGLPVEAVSAE